MLLLVVEKKEYIDHKTSQNNYLIQAIFAVMIARALYSASADDLETMYYFFDVHKIGFEPGSTTNPEVDLLSFGSPAQSASLVDCKCIGHGLK